MSEGATISAPASAWDKAILAKCFEKSRELYREAERLIPGGVNSPVRAFRAVERDPLFIDHGEGAYVTDADGNTYIDYVGSYGPLILGHRHPAVMQALQDCTARVGTGFGAPTVQENRLAAKIVGAFPAVEMVRMVNSGTEATMSALRLARAYTGRSKILKFEGCYHGHHDSLLIKAGSGALTMGVPSSPGVPVEIAGGTITAAYNDLDGVKKIFHQLGPEIAAVIIEPAAGNMGTVNPVAGFLEGLRELTAENGTLLIFDEVMTGFRALYGGVQNLHGLQPDLTCLGKIIGGGLPVGAYGGRREIMEMVAPAGPVYQAGTLSGNPLAMTAGLVTLEELAKPDAYAKLLELTQKFAVGLREAALEHGIPVTVNRFGSMLTCFFTAEPVNDYQSATGSNQEHFKKFFNLMLERGVYLPPSQYETWFVSMAHGEKEIQQTLDAACEAFRIMGSEER